MYIIAVAAGCSLERDGIYGITWPSTTINMNATNNCPNGTGMDALICTYIRTYNFI